MRSESEREKEIRKKEIGDRRTRENEGFELTETRGREHREHGERRGEESPLTIKGERIFGRMYCI